MGILIDDSDTDQWVYLPWPKRREYHMRASGMDRHPRVRIVSDGMFPSWEQIVIYGPFLVLVSWATAEWFPAQITPYGVVVTFLSFLYLIGSLDFSTKSYQDTAGWELFRKELSFKVTTRLPNTMPDVNIFITSVCAAAIISVTQSVLPMPELLAMIGFLVTIYALFGIFDVHKLANWGWAIILLFTGKALLGIEGLVYEFYATAIFIFVARLSYRCSNTEPTYRYSREV